MANPRKIIEKIRKRNEFLKFVKEQVPTLQETQEDISIHIFLLSWIAGEIKGIPHGEVYFKKEVLEALKTVVNTWGSPIKLPKRLPGAQRKAKSLEKPSSTPGGIYRKKKGNKGFFAYHIYRENGKKREKYLGVFNKLTKEQAKTYKETPSISVQIIDSTRNIFELYFLHTKSKKKFLGHTTLQKSGY